MYPNPQDVLPLPPSPDIGQYRKRAKDLTRACRSGAASAFDEWARRWLDDLTALLPDDRARDAAGSRDRRMTQLSTFARERLTSAACALTQAQFVIARAHGFESWQKLVRHLEGLAGNQSRVSTFEAAADAIIRGHDAELARLLREHPDLATARSDREHRATLLHYVSANGVENYRQQTPANIVAIARRLLDAGAEVDAECDVYGGGATPLYLTVTSAHPRAAGVQNELADLLLDRGARMRPGLIRHCLANGCPEAARHLIGRGAPVNLEEAAGLGDIELVRQRFPNAGPQQGTEALLMACWYDERRVIAYLLDAGIEAGVRHPETGETPLHIAAWLGSPELVELLLRNGAPPLVHDGRYDTAPIDWALQGWLVDHRQPEDRYRQIVRMLMAAGAEIRPRWREYAEVKSLQT